MNGTRESILYLFALSSPPGHWKYKETKIKLFQKLKKSVSFQMSFYLEDDDHKPIDFNGETISFFANYSKYNKEMNLKSFDLQGKQ